MKKTKKSWGGVRENAGRKPSENPKSTIFKLRLTPGEKMSLESQAAKAGQTVAGWVRDRLGL